MRPVGASSVQRDEQAMAGNSGQEFVEQNERFKWRVRGIQSNAVVNEAKEEVNYVHMS